MRRADSDELPAELVEAAAGDRPSVPTELTDATQKMPVAMAPQVPPTPCTPTTSSESSRPILARRRTAK